jgi:hypothetical protein
MAFSVPDLRWTRLEEALGFLARLVAPHKWLVPLYRKLLGKYVDMESLRQFEVLVQQWEAQASVRQAQHTKQGVEEGARATTSLAWLMSSAMVDLVLGKIVHGVIKDLFDGILSEATTHFGFAIMLSASWLTVLVKL